jgi:hypothetical protein
MMLVVKAILSPSRRGGILASIFLTSNSNKPIKIPTKVPNIPIWIRREGQTLIRFCDLWVLEELYKMIVIKKRINNKEVKNKVI